MPNARDQITISNANQVASASTNEPVTYASVVQQAAQLPATPLATRRWELNRTPPAATPTTVHDQELYISAVSTPQQTAVPACADELNIMLSEMDDSDLELSDAEGKRTAVVDAASSTPMTVAGSEDDEPSAKRLRTVVHECSLQAQANTEAQQLITTTLADVQGSVVNVSSTMLAVSANLQVLGKDVVANKKAIAEINTQLKKAHLETAGNSNSMREMEANIAEVSNGMLVASEMHKELVEEVRDNRVRETRLSEVVVRGIPLQHDTPMDALVSMFVALASSLGCVVDAVNLDRVFMIPVGRSGAGGRMDYMIVVRFSRQMDRRELMRCYFANDGHADTSCLSLGLNTVERVFISDNLTPLSSAIRKRAVALRNNGRLAATSVYEGQVFVLVRVGDRKVPVYTLADLERMALPESDGSQNQNQNASQNNNNNGNNGNNNNNGNNGNNSNGNSNGGQNQNQNVSQINNNNGNNGSNNNGNNNNGNRNNNNVNRNNNNNRNHNNNHSGQNQNQNVNQNNNHNGNNNGNNGNNNGNNYNGNNNNGNGNNNNRNRNHKNNNNGNGNNNNRNYNNNNNNNAVNRQQRNMFATNGIAATNRGRERDQGGENGDRADRGDRGDESSPHGSRDGNNYGYRGGRGGGSNGQRYRRY